MAEAGVGVPADYDKEELENALKGIDKYSFSFEYYRRFVPTDYECHFVAIHPQNPHIFATSSREINYIDIWNENEKVNTLRIDSEKGKFISCVIFHPSEPFLASCSRSGFIKLWNVNPQNIECTELDVYDSLKLSGKRQPFRSITFHPLAPILAAIFDPNKDNVLDNRVILFYISSPSPVRAEIDHLIGESAKPAKQVDKQGEFIHLGSFSLGLGFFDLYIQNIVFHHSLQHLDLLCTALSGQQGMNMYIARVNKTKDGTFDPQLQLANITPPPPLNQGVMEVGRLLYTSAISVNPKEPIPVIAVDCYDSQRGYISPSIQFIEVTDSSGGVKDFSSRFSKEPIVYDKKRSYGKPITYQHGIYSLNFDPTGTMLASCFSFTNDIKLWSFQHGNLLKTITVLEENEGEEGKKKEVYTAVFHPEEINHTFVAGTSCGFVIFNYENKKEMSKDYLDAMHSLVLRTDICSICWTKVSDPMKQPAIHLPNYNEEYLQCGHIFHKKCIDEVIKTNGPCPLCRMKNPVSTSVTPAKYLAARTAAIADRARAASDAAVVGDLSVSSPRTLNFGPSKEQEQQAPPGSNGGGKNKNKYSRKIYRSKSNKSKKNKNKGRSKKLKFRRRYSKKHNNN